MKTRNGFARLLARIHKPWIHATVGSALIILSTFGSGFWLYRISNEIDALRVEIATRREQIAQSERHSDHADLISTLHDISDHIVDDISDPNVRAAVVNLGIIREFQALARRSWAAGKESLDTSLLRKAQEQQKRGDNGGYLMLLEVERRLLDEEFRYKEVLRREIEQRDKRLRSLENSRNLLSFAALFCQVTGLVFLLLKEMPARITPNGDIEAPAQ